MMASLVLDLIRSALKDRRSRYTSWCGDRNMFKVKNLEIFVLCARKLDNDGQLTVDDKVSTLGSLLQTIHDTLSKFVADSSDLHWFDFPSDIEEQISHWYNTLSDSLPQLTFHEVIDIIDTILETLHFVLSWFRDYPVTGIEAMVEKITFLRNLIRFSTLPSVEPPQLENLLVHSRAVSVNAAHISHDLCKNRRFGTSDTAPDDPVLVQKINNLIDPGVYEMYAKVLISSKLSTQLHSPTPTADHDPLVAMKDFIDFLLWKLWEEIQRDTRIAISTRVELQLLYEGLRLLRCMLKEQPNKFHEELRDLTRVIICEAGIIIFSLNEKNVEEIVVSISDFMPRINRIKQDVEGEDLSISDLRQRFDLTREGVGGNDLPKTNELGFMDFLLENLVEMTSSEACYGFRTQFQKIHDHFSSLRRSLGEIEEVCSEQKELETLWNAGIKVAYRVEFLIDQLVLGDFQGSSSASFDSPVEDIDQLLLGDFQGSSSASLDSSVEDSDQLVLGDFQGSSSAAFDSTVEDILEEIKSTISAIHDASVVKVKKARKTSNFLQARSSVLPIADEIVGFHDDAATIINRLRRGSKELKTIAIVGMPGIGKTTLATKVFNDPYVTLHFNIRATCCVSQLFDRKKVFLELLNNVDPNGNFDKMAEHDLADKLRRCLKWVRYLIFLDDVWDIEDWNCLQASFPDDSCGSRIILTSRHRDVALLDEDPHFVRQLTEDESWELLQKKLFHESDCSLELYELGKQIAANCKGLPLTVVVVAGLLANMKAEGWKNVLENISSVSNSDDHCMKTLELSYNHLPGYLKPCFLYFGLFPEDHGVFIKRLIRLWIAEGFILKTESKSLEDVARGYVMDLVGRSLVIVSKTRSIGGVKACRIHDVLHDFCRIKAKEERFFQLLKGGYEEVLCFEEPSYMRRLCVHSGEKHFKNLRLFCPHMHSLLFFPRKEGHGRRHDISFNIFRRYRRLRVLDLRHYVLGLGGIPSEIGVFLQLKYLSVRGDIREVPSSIGNLANLETLIIFTNFRSEKIVSLPDTFWNLQKLRHLAIKEYFCFFIENLEDIRGGLYELQSCSCVCMDDERLIRNFPNIRRLDCELLWEDYNAISMLDSLTRLESLRLSRYLRGGDSLGPLPECYLLKKLTLLHFSLHQSEISIIGKLPNLEVLKLETVDFDERTWDVVEGEFSTLKSLTLTSSDIVRWRALDDHEFPCLQKLVLLSCRDLEVIDICFANINTLEIIIVSRCSKSVNRFFKRIQREQMEIGNLDLKIRIFE